MSADRETPAASTADVAVPPPGPVSIALVIVLFAALHGYTLLQAVSNLVALPGVYELLGIGDAIPWWLLLIGVAAPVAFFVSAVLLGRRHSLAHRVLLFAVSLGAANAVALSVAALVAALQPALGA